MVTKCNISEQIKLAPITFCNYKLTIYKKEMRLTFPQVLQFRQKINDLTTPIKLIEIIENDNFVLLFIADKQHLVYLDVPQLLHLKEELEYFFCSF